MPEIIIFGTIFSYNEKDYVYLDRSEEIIYVAHVFDKEFSKKFIKLRDNTAKNSTQSYQFGQKITYCFVELKTKEYFERIAHYGFPPLDDISEVVFEPIVIGRLCEEDIKELYKQITEDDLAVSPELKERIKNILI